MFARITSAAVLGIDAYPVEVETDISSTVPSFTIVGLPDASVNESKERVRSAINNSDLSFPYRRITVNLAPAHVRKEGSTYDLPIAIGLLAASDQILCGKLEEYMIVGELALDGNVRPVKGVLPISAMMAEGDVKKIILPMENAPEASLVKGIEIYPVSTLKEAVNLLQAPGLFTPFEPGDELSHDPEYPVDFADVKGHQSAKRALEVAAAGGHNLLMMGPPGSGKTMLAKRLPSILPPMTMEEALEVTRIYSISGLLPSDRPLMSYRPFRSPHHSASRPGLVGGGQYPRPGEVSLAHRGVLFLDELPEFERATLEVLRQPMEDGNVTISRANQTISFPASFMMVASMNPCPCGYSSDREKECTCSIGQIRRYRSKISGPLMDRIDIQMEVPRLKFDELSSNPNGEPSSVIRDRVTQAREIQLKRFKQSKVFCNGDMSSRHLQKHCKVPGDARELIRMAVDRLGLSGRAYDRILKLSRTIADLSGGGDIATEHVAEAIQYRSLDRNEGAY